MSPTAKKRSSSARRATAPAKAAPKRKVRAAAAAKSATPRKTSRKGAAVAAAARKPTARRGASRTEPRRTGAQPAAPAKPPLRIRNRSRPARRSAAGAAAAPLDLAAVRVRLVEKKEQIVAMYLNDLKSGQESNDSPTEDIVDRANNAYTRELSFSISDAERSLLLQVEEAIARVDAGTFGACAHCGEPIPRPRLEAIPWARFCIQCQELLEQGLLSET